MKIQHSIIIYKHEHDEEYMLVIDGKARLDLTKQDIVSAVGNFIAAAYEEEDN